MLFMLFILAFATTFYLLIDEHVSIEFVGYRGALRQLTVLSY